LQLADGYLVSHPSLRLGLTDFFHVLPALDSAPDLYAAAHFKARGETRVPSPADTGNVIRLSIGAVDCNQEIRDLPAERRLPVYRSFTDITVQKNLIGFRIFHFFLQEFHLPGKNGKHKPVFLLLMPVIGTELSRYADEFSRVIFLHVDQPLRNHDWYHIC